MIIGNFEARKYRFNRWPHLIVASFVAVHLTSVERHVLFKVSYFVVQLRHSWGRKSVKKRRYNYKQPNENYRDPQNNPERPSRVDLNNGYISDSVKSNPVRLDERVRWAEHYFFLLSNWKRLRHDLSTFKI